MAHPTQLEGVKEMRDDIFRRYQSQGPRIETLWRSFDQAKREQCIRVTAHKGRVLQHADDRSLGSMYSICFVVSEWNIRDITEEGSDFMIEMLKHRATKTLSEQVLNGVNGGPGGKEKDTTSEIS